MWIFLVVFCFSNFSICRKNGLRFHYSFIAIFDSVPLGLYVFLTELEILSQMDIAYIFCPSIHPSYPRGSTGREAANHANDKREKMDCISVAATSLH